jgi:hypothetical protein
MADGAAHNGDECGTARRVCRLRLGSGVGRLEESAEACETAVEVMASVVQTLPPLCADLPQRVSIIDGRIFFLQPIRRRLESDLRKLGRENVPHKAKYSDIPRDALVCLFCTMPIHENKSLRVRSHFSLGKRRTPPGRYPITNLGAVIWLQKSGETSTEL